MFAETIIAAFLLGFLACWTIAIITVQRLARDHRRAYRRLLREQRLQALRAEVRAKHITDIHRPHKGTPYRSPLPNDLERVLVDVAGPHLDDRLADNSRWSVKAPTLRSVS